MKDYWLAKLIGSVQEGRVESRKRLQKSIYLLQRGGCPLQCEYILHYYGPYSFELADLMDQLRAAKIIEEEPEQMAPGYVRYKSAITERGKSVVNSFEQTRAGKQALSQIKGHIPKFQQLMQKDPWVLELGATVAYYYVRDWDKARSRAAAFKRIPQNDPALDKAAALAEEFAGKA